MLSALAALLGLLGHGPQGQIEVTRFNVQGWTVSISQDRFTGGVACRASNHQMSATAKVVVFKFGRRVDTSNAVYRLNFGPAYAVADLPVDRELRRIVEVNPPLENPSSGVVAVPVSMLAGITQVSVRANVQTAPQTFDVSRLPAVLQFETSHGCFADEDPQRPSLIAPTETPASR